MLLQARHIVLPDSYQNSYSSYHANGQIAESDLSFSFRCVVLIIHEGRRFATFKIFYHPHTPLSYEPPHFRPGDAEQDRWYFTTHEKDEVPEKCSVGKLETGWHGHV